MPFSNGDVPEDENLRADWKKLVDGARALHEAREEQERTNKCTDLAKQKGIEALPSEVYDIW